MVGIGALEPSPLLRRSGSSIAEADQEKLRVAGAVGDVCLRFFDENGDPVASDLDERVIGIEPDALRGNWINVLITDIRTARALLED